MAVSLAGPTVLPRAAFAAVVLRLARFWVAALLIVELADLSGIVRGVVLVIGVTIGIVDIGSRKRPAQVHRRSIGGLRSDHSRAALILALQLAIMTGIAICALATAAIADRFVAPPMLVVPTPKDGVVALGVVLFSLTGTGHVNTAKYSLMRSRAGIATVIDGSLRIAVIAQGAWLLATAATVPTSALADLDAQKSFSTVGIADAIAQTAPSVGKVVLVIGAILILFGLSNATSSCAETIAIEFTVGSADQTRGLQIAAIVGTAAVAIAIAGAGVSATGILAVSGLGGGILIIFVLPILAEPDPELHRLRRNQAIGVTGSVIAVSAISVGTTGPIALTWPTSLNPRPIANVFDAVRDQLHR